ncbi:hypothetical protein NC652_030823 [Populus alba x Populus x berolinensis]|nr:hypothetical protein NC652_030823 [Populus alba x Populus x berolinensis]
MAGICSLNPTTLMTFKRIHGIRFFSGATDNEKKSQTRTKTPPILKLAVSGVTELLRVFCFSGKERLEKVNNKDRDEITVSGIDDVIMILKSDYENAYFVTGFLRAVGFYVRGLLYGVVSFLASVLCFLAMFLTHKFWDCVGYDSMKISTLLSIEDPDNYLKAGVFTSAIYDEDCIFEDPTIKFQGTKLYSRNLKFLVPFFNCPSIGLQAIEKVIRANPDVLTVRTICFWKHIVKSSPQLIVQTT